jgi:hypothetical protein
MHNQLANSHAITRRGPLLSTNFLPNKPAKPEPEPSLPLRRRTSTGPLRGPPPTLVVVVHREQGSGKAGHRVFLVRDTDERADYVGEDGPGGVWGWSAEVAMQPPQAGALLILERYLPHEFDMFPCQGIIKAC